MSKLTGSRKALQFTESVIREMTRLSDKHGGVNLSQGFPDFAAPAAVKEAACAAINAEINQYAVTWGARPLREAIARAFTSRYGVEVIADEQVTVCCGATEAMMSTMTAIIDPGDEVIVFEPFYENYGPDAILSGATPRYVTLHEPDWTLRPGRAGRRIQREDEGDHHQHAEQSDGQGVHAPGARNDRRALPEVGRHRDLRRDLRAHHLRRAQARPDRDDSGHGRAHRDAQQPVEDLQRHGMAGGLDDLAAVADRGDPQGPRLPDRRRAGAASGSRAPSRWRCRTSTTSIWPRSTGACATCCSTCLERNHFTCYRPYGAYYIMTDIAGFGFRDDVEFARYLVKDVGVAAVPGSSFYKHAEKGRTKLRFCFCKKDETLAEAERRLAKVAPARALSI